MKIKPPTSCPSCKSDLIWRSQLLYCINQFCKVKDFKKVEHFIKTLKIKGLGPKTIEKLRLANPIEIYSLSKEHINNVLGSEKLSKKIIQEIDKSRNVDLKILLPAFSIPLLGKSASEKLCKTVSHISEINQQTCTEAGLGPKVSENLLNWLKDFIVDDWPFTFKVKKEQKIETIKGIVCITGKLNSFRTKAEAKKYLLNKGYAVKDSVTNDVNILVNESGIESTKVKKARDKNIKIITNIKDLFGE